MYLFMNGSHRVPSDASIPNFREDRSGRPKLTMCCCRPRRRIVPRQGTEETFCHCALHGGVAGIAISSLPLKRRTRHTQVGGSLQAGAVRTNPSGLGTVSQFSAAGARVLVE